MSLRWSACVAAHLLRGHVADGAHDDAGLGVPRRAWARSWRPVPRRRLVGGEAEVEDLDAPVARDEDVLGLDVPVDDALLVGGGEAVGHLDGVLDGLAHGQGPAREGARAGSPLRGAP